MEVKMQENRFSDRYAHQQVDWYSLKTYRKGDTDFYPNSGVEIRTRTLLGRADEYFNKRFWIRELDVPIMLIDGCLWMSLTPLEIQSMILPISRSWGHVGTGGLGMGYFALKCAEKYEVEEIKVWETNTDVIEFFNNSFSHRKGFGKIKIINEDVRKIKDQQFSYFFMDIYQTLLPDIVLEDTNNFWKNGNDAGTYEFWAQEKALLQYVVDGNRPFLEPDEQILFAEFWECSYPHKSDTVAKKLNLYHELSDKDFVNKIVRDYLGR
jgi:hypothetical protein